MISTVLFDKDGTLFDFRSSWGDWTAALCLDLAGGDSGRAATIADAIGFDMENRAFSEDSPVIAGTPGEIAELLLPFVPGMSPAGLVSKMNVLAAEAPQVEAAPLMPLMQDLRRRGMTLGVITNDAMSPAKAHLRSAGILHHIERVIGCDCGFGQKPGPGQIRAFLEITGVEPSETVMVGDSAHDLAAARAAGCHGIGVLTGLATERQLAPLATAVLPSIAELPAWLMNWNRATAETDAA